MLNLGGYLELAFEREFIGNSVGVEHAEGLLYVLDIIEVEEDIAVSIEAELLEWLDLVGQLFIRCKVCVGVMLKEVDVSSVDLGPVFDENWLHSQQKHAEIVQCDVASDKTSQGQIH